MITHVQSRLPFMLASLAILAGTLRATPPIVEYALALDTISRGYDGVYCWVHPRAGIVPRGPNRSPAVVLTMQRLLLTGSDVMYPVNEMRTNNLGRTWMGPYEHPDTLGRREASVGSEEVPSGLWPQWHAKSGKLLMIGETINYVQNTVEAKIPRKTCYSVYDAENRKWSQWTTLAIDPAMGMPSEGAGSVQRFDLENGDILLPTYFLGEGEGEAESRGEAKYRVAVMRCRFDGTTLTVLEKGNVMTLKSGRGLYEPSITRFGGRYFLTLRNDDAGYVAVSDDGLHFGPPQAWTWDDGTDLGNYNTQQHWVTHRDGLFLVYTRRGASNDHVMRNRAPLFIAQVDPERLTIIRATERILVPERGARLGNFGVTYVNPDETWVTVAEWMQKVSPTRDWTIPVDNARGADNSVYVARILWKTPNVELPSSP